MPRTYTPRWPNGVRIIFSIPHPSGSAMLQEDILEGRDFLIEDGALRILDRRGEMIRLVNWPHVLILTALTPEPK